MARPKLEKINKTWTQPNANPLDKSIGKRGTLPAISTRPSQPTQQAEPPSGLDERGFDKVPAITQANPTPGVVGGPAGEDAPAAAVPQPMLAPIVRDPLAQPVLRAGGTDPLLNKMSNALPAPPGGPSLLDKIKQARKSIQPADAADTADAADADAPCTPGELGENTTQEAAGASDTGQQGGEGMGGAGDDTGEGMGGAGDDTGAPADTAGSGTGVHAANAPGTAGSGTPVHDSSETPDAGQLGSVPAGTNAHEEPNENAAQDRDPGPPGDGLPASDVVQEDGACLTESVADRDIDPETTQGADGDSDNGEPVHHPMDTSAI